MIVVTGFGPFLDVEDNPSGRLAQAVDGARIGGHTVLGQVLPVSYERAPRRALELARRRPALILGLGVAASRTGAQVERVAVNAGSTQNPDVDGVWKERLGDGPDALRCGIADELAAALRIETSDDAGRYVCNAWLYGLLRHAPRTPAAFVHIADASALEPTALLEGLGRWLEAR